jgi:sugar phosphate isomerase/epimerase
MRTRPRLLSRRRLTANTKPLYAGLVSQEKREPTVALSTMWSQGRFRTDGAERDDMVAFARKAKELGFSYAEINYVIPPEGVNELIECGVLEFTSVHSPCPRVKTADGKHSDALNLAASDEEERRLGGLPHVFDEEKSLRKLFDEGQRDGEHVEKLRASGIERRHREGPSHFPFAQKSLAEIAEYASKKGVTIGLENRYHYHEYPDPDEMKVLLADYPPEVAGFWLDIGHAEVLERLGFLPHNRWLDELADRCVGTHVHDVDGLADHRAPGFGTADWPHYSAKLPPHIPRVNEINQRQDEERVGGAIAYLRKVGALG